jgi:hypothetical protein
MGETLYRFRKYVLLGVKKTKISSQSSKSEFQTQNQYDRVIDREIYMEQEKIYCTQKIIRPVLGHMYAQ